MDRRNILKAVLGTVAVVPTADAAGKTELPGSFWRKAARISACEGTEDLGVRLTDLGCYIEDTSVEDLGPLMDCLPVFHHFVVSAKPEEIQTLNEMLYQWQNYVGQLRKGNFFREVARRVATNQETDSLVKWPKDEAAPRRRS